MKLRTKSKYVESLKRGFYTFKYRMLKTDIANTSVVVAYYLLLSLFPLLIAVGNILPYLHINPNSVLPYIAEAIPASIYDDLESSIQALLTQRSGGLLSLSALATLWSSSQSINALQGAMNKAFGVEARKNFIVVRLLSIFVIILLLIALVGVVIVLGLGKMILDSIQPIFLFSTDFIDTFQTLKWPITSFVLLVIMCLIYKVVPNTKVTFISIIPGAIVSTVGWMLLSQVFGLYLSYFSSKIASYQIIGSFIVLILWLNFASIIIVLGGVINATVNDYRHKNAKRKIMFLYEIDDRIEKNKEI